MTTQEVINGLIKDNGYKNYLEIGFGTGETFHAVKCEKKTAVDPTLPESSGQFRNADSDTFFRENEGTFDIIFIDGDHLADQVRKDIIGASKCLSENGVILVHDIDPEREDMTGVPRQVKEWTGTVFQAWQGFKEKYPDVETEEYPVQYGLGAIRPKGKKFKAHFEVKELTWSEYQERKKSA